jgi:hypothetical protein
MEGMIGAIDNVQRGTRAKCTRALLNQSQIGERRGSLEE